MKNTSLFRFLSLRRPQSPVATAQTVQFLHYPTGIKSHFLSEKAPDLSTESHSNTQPPTFEALLQKASDFTPIQSAFEIKDAYPRLHALGKWAANDQSTITYEALQNQSKDLQSLQNEMLSTLWDNLIYQRLSGPDPSITYSIQHTLRGNQLLMAFQAYAQNPTSTITNTQTNTNTQENFTTEDAHHFQAIAKSILVLPGSLSTPQHPDEAISQTTQLNISPLLKQAAAHHSSIKVQELESVIQELKQIRRQYQEALNKEFNEAWTVYEKALATSLKTSHHQAHTKYEGPAGDFEEAGDFGEASYGVPQTPSHQTAQDNPSFDFRPSTQLDSTYLEQHSSPTARAWFTTATSPEKDFSQTIETLEEQLNQTYTQQYQSLKTGNQFGLVENNPIPLEPEPPRFSCVLKTHPVTGQEGKRQSFLTIHHDPRNPVMAVTLEQQDAAPLTTDQITNQQGPYRTFRFPISDTRQVQQAISIAHTTAGPDTESNTSNRFTARLRLSNGTNILIEESLSLPGGIRVGTAIPQEPAMNIPQIKTGVTQLGLAVFRKVEQSLSCYVEGEVSHIENILAKEYKERNTRYLTRSESETTESREEEQENQTDTVSTDRFEMQSEIEQVLNENRAMDAGLSAGLNGKIPGVGEFSTAAFSNFSTANSTTESQGQAIRHAREVTERALDRLIRRVSFQRTSRILKEFEETNRHGFDNREGDSHVTGVYRWVDKMYENRVVNFGKRLLYEFMLPEPARNFKEALMNPENGSQLIPVLEKPQAPKEIGLSSPQQLNAHNYLSIAGYYGAAASTVPPAELRISKAYAEHVQDPEGYPATDRAVAFTDFEIPEGYVCDEVKVAGSFEMHGENKNPGFGLELIIGNKKLPLYHSHQLDLLTQKILPTTGKLPISFRSRDIGTLNFNVIALCKLSKAALEKWQLETYHLIQEAYQEKLETWYQSVNRSGTTAVNDLKINPAHSRRLEKQELKRISIELLTAPFSIPMGGDHYFPANQHGVFKVNRSTHFNTQAGHTRFLELAFDWENMAYTFYPYYWAHEGRWQNLYQSKNEADHLFQAFLQAGMARTVVPVRPGYEQAVLLFMKTGLIWEGQDLQTGDPGDDHLSALQDLQREEPTIEETWETRVPTALTIVQEQAAPLAGNGLPCLSEDGNAIATGNNVLNGFDQVQN